MEVKKPAKPGSRPVPATMRPANHPLFHRPSTMPMPAYPRGTRTEEPLTCPKCHHENPASARFCLRCHMALQFVCPACSHIQDHAGQCDRCGIDFLKYLAMMEFQMEAGMRKQRQRSRARSAILKQIVLLPLTGGYSLLKGIRSILVRD
jgi:hypothetical protein